MDWVSELRTLRIELDSFRAARQERLAQLKDLFQSLQIESALSEMNRILLDGQGEMEVYTSWEPKENVDREQDVVEVDGEAEDESDSISAVLTWREEWDREIAVDLIIAERESYLQVNDVDIRLDQDAVRQALIRAFREEMGL